MNQENNENRMSSEASSTYPESNDSPSQPLTPPVALQESVPVVKAKVKHSTAVEVVLQWLTYVFWFWVLAIISIVLSATLSYFFVEKFGNTEWIVYVSASLLVLLPAAFFADKYYKKIEPEKKHGFAAVIMVVNAVIACLISVASMITVVVTLVSLIVGAGESTGKAITILSSSVVATLSFLFFLRIVKIEVFSYITKHFSKIVVGVVILTLVLTIAGPMIHTSKRKTDRLIESNYYGITSGIDEYTRDEDKLPESLSAVDFSDGAQDAIDTGRVTYKKKTASSNDDDSPRFISQNSSTRSQLYYEICIDWEFEKEGSSYGSSSRYYGGSHKQGEQCYDESVYIY